MSNATCPYIRSSDEGTHWCALAESSVKERDVEIARLREALEKIHNHSWMFGVDQVRHVAREALTAHMSVCSHCGGTRYVATRGDTGVVKRPCCWCQDKHAPVAGEKPV